MNDAAGVDPAARIRGPDLHARRLHGRVAASAGEPIGALDYSGAATEGGLGLKPIRPAAIDQWLGSGRDVIAGHRGAAGRRLEWRDDGQFVFGRIDVAESGTEDTTLEDAASTAYASVFATLGDRGRPQLLRVWNYVPRINADQGGLERYRRFNLGRQRAFAAAGEDAFTQAPAACAVGRDAGPLTVCFLASRRPWRRIENPRQVSAYRYGAHYGPASPSFSRATLGVMDDDHLALLISGTASIVGQESCHPGDPARQTVETLANLRAVIDAAHGVGSARFELGTMALTIYLRNPRDWPVVERALREALGDEAALRDAVAVQADICRADLLVEIEAHAVRPGALR